MRLYLSLFHGHFRYILISYKFKFLYTWKYIKVHMIQIWPTGTRNVHSIRFKGGLETHLSRMIVWSSLIWSFNGKSFSWGPICPWMSLMVWFSHGSVSSWHVSAAALLRAKRTCFAACSGLSLLFSCWLWHGIFSIRSVAMGLKLQERNYTKPPGPLKWWLFCSTDEVFSDPLSRHVYSWAEETHDAETRSREQQPNVISHVHMIG